MTTSGAGFSPLNFPLESAQQDLAGGIVPALVASVHDSFSEWLQTPFPKGLPTSTSALGSCMAIGTFGQLSRYHIAAMPELHHGKSSDGQPYTAVRGVSGVMYALRAKLATADDLRVRDTGRPANAEYLAQRPLTDANGKPIPPRRLNLVYRLDVTQQKLLGIYLTLGRPSIEPWWIWQLDGTANHQYPIYQMLQDPVTGRHIHYATYCPTGIRLP